MISVGIIGGTGYTGKYLIKFCNQHSFVAEYIIYANNTAGNYLFDIFPEMQNSVHNQEIQSVTNLSYEHDLYFVALPHGESLNYIPQLIENGKKVIDLGGDFRLNDPELYPKWYGFEHTYKNLLSEKIYGLADYDANKLFGHLLIANPGCYPTTVLLSVLPLLNELSENIISISSVAYSGTSGAGKSPKTSMLLSEMDGNAKAYNVNSHRHEPEILQKLIEEGFESHFSFTTHLLPIATGIYSTTSIFFDKKVISSDIIELYKTKYLKSPFVRLRKDPPELKWVIGTNYCDINISVKESKMIVTCAIDNLIKGASGQAIQNMNLIYGYSEKEGIINQIKSKHLSAVEEF